LAPLPLPRAAVGHRGRRLGLHALPSSVQRHDHRSRRTCPARARTPKRRGRRRLAVRQGSLRLPVLPRRGAHHRAADPRRGSAAACHVAAGALKRAGANAAAIAGGQSTGEEGHLLARLMREGLGSPHLDSRRAGTLSLDAHRALGAPALQAKVSDLEFAHAVLVLDTDPVNDASILDLRLRKGIRRRGLKLAVASPGPSSLDPSAALSIRFKPGAGAAFAAALSAALGASAELETLCGEAGVESAAVRELAELLRGPEPQQGADSELQPREVVILWGERLTAAPNAELGAGALLGIAEALDLANVEGAGMLEVPATANGRGLREAGVLPNAGPGLSQLQDAGRDSAAIAEGLAAGELSALYLLQCDPLRELA